jgi:hypothetical protein
VSFLYYDGQSISMDSPVFNLVPCVDLVHIDEDATESQINNILSFTEDDNDDDNDDDSGWNRTRTKMDDFIQTERKKYSNMVIRDHIDMLKRTLKMTMDDYDPLIEDELFNLFQDYRDVASQKRKRDNETLKQKKNVKRSKSM